MKKYFVRYKRYALFLFNWIFKEKIRGLDFTMRDKSLLKQADGKLHGYSITPEKHLKEIFSNLSIQSTDKFIDIGCGKGFVLRYASKFPFIEILGIDIDKRLIDIANQNLTKLKLENVKAICVDAITFDLYSDYTHFFFFNPFGIEVFSQVFDKILQSTPRRKITVIYYNPTCADYIFSTGKLELKYKLYDPMREYYTHIYESKSDD